MSKYTKEELLSFYSETLPLPSNAVQLRGVVYSVSSKPVLLQARGQIKAKDQLSKVRREQKEQPAPVRESVSQHWYYIDGSGNIAQPQPSENMNRWWVNGQFPVDLKVCPATDNNKPTKEMFNSVAFYFPDLSLGFAYNPFRFESFAANPRVMSPTAQLLFEFESP